MYICGLKSKVKHNGRFIAWPDDCNKIFGEAGMTYVWVDIETKEKKEISLTFDEWKTFISEIKEASLRLYKGGGK